MKFNESVIPLFICCIILIIIYMSTGPKIIASIRENITFVTNSIQESKKIQVWVIKDANPEEVYALGEKLKTMPEIENVQFVSKEETANKYKERLKEYPNAAEAIETEYFSDSYIITLKQISSKQKIEQKITEIENWKKTTSKKNVFFN